MDAVSERTTLEESEERTVVFAALLGALGRVPIWLLVWGLTLLGAAALATPWLAWFRDAVAHRYETVEVLHHLDVVFRTDHSEALSRLDEGARRGGAVLALFAMLAGVFFAGGWLQVALERTQGQSVRRFFFGGARYYLRFLRLAVITLLLLALFGWLLYGKPWNELVLGRWLGVPEHDWGDLETLESEWTVLQLRGLQHGLFLLVFGYLMTWGDYTRTRLALHDTGSALWAGFLTFFSILRHPIKTLRPMLGLLLLEVAVIVGAAYLVGWIEEGLRDAASGWRLWAVVGLGQLVLLWRHVIRGARYFAAVAVSKDIVRPLFRPDPWKDSIGGPGGPRYPLEEGDEYGVSL